MEISGAAKYNEENLFETPQTFEVTYRYANGVTIHCGSGVKGYRGGTTFEGERGTIFVEPGSEVYEGMVIGENARNEDMDVNPVREKKLTNMRAAGSDDADRLVPPKHLNLEQALEFCREDECIEVTPKMVRVRKVHLSQTDRARAVSLKKKANSQV